MLPSNAELTYFIEVCSTLNLSRASERLGISQPSLSMAIRRLEKSVGTKLFVRHKNGVTLTQPGKQLLIHARQLLQYWDETKSKTLASEDEIQGSFTIGCNSTIVAHIVSLFLPDLLENYPKLHLHLKHDISRRIAEQVINLSIDFGIVVNPIKHPDLIIRKLCKDETSFWVGTGKRTIQNSKSDHAVILCDTSLNQTDILLAKCKNFGLSTDRIVSVPSLNAVAALCAAGAGIGIIPTRVALALYPRDLSPLPKAPSYSDEICLIYRNELRQVQAAQTIIEAIKKSLNV
jgi:LysR family transcriptional regulator, cell division regulator